MTEAVVTEAVAPRASWSRRDGADCVRVRGLPAGATVAVRPAGTLALEGAPPMAGRVVHDRGEVCFVPRFPFREGTSYAVLVDGAPAAVLVRPGRAGVSTTEVLGVYPTSSEVPRNLLRCYVWFSAPMSEGYAARHVRLVDEAGDPLPGALPRTEEELWDADRRRLTVLLDPARIKRGLVGHRELGYPLRGGVPFRLLVDAGFRDARGMPLRAPADRRYQVVGDLRGLLEPRRWHLAAPASGGREPLEVTFDRTLDHGLLLRCLRVAGPDGRRVGGTPAVGGGERCWGFTPARGWAAGRHHLLIDPVLEDVAGNSLSRVFDRDLGDPADEPVDARPAALAFHPR
jgi:hypothetical protein